MSLRVSTSWCVGRALHISLAVNDWLQVNASGNVVRSEILGAVKMKCYLSGMPELRLGLNDKVMFESTGRSTYHSSRASAWLTRHSQLLEARPSKWKTSSSTNVFVCPGSRTTVLSRLSRQTVNSS